MPQKRQTKKRKKADNEQDEDYSPQRKESKIFALDSEINREELLFEKMSMANEELLSLAKEVQYVDHNYFVKNNDMVDEFIGNVNLFLKEIDRHRRRVSSDLLNPDILLSIFRFLRMKNLVSSCQLVCKFWREIVKKCKFSISWQRKDKKNVTVASVKKCLTGFSQSIVSIKNMCNLSVSGVVAISTSKKLHNLTQLSCKNMKMDSKTIDTLKNFVSVNSLVGLNFSCVDNSLLSNIEEFSEIFNGNLLSSSGVKRLAISKISAFRPILQTLSSVKQLDQLTHLAIDGNSSDNLDEFLRGKVNLEYLSLKKHSISRFPKLFIDCKQFENLSWLNISEVATTQNQVLDIIVSNSLPNLTTLIATKLNLENFQPYTPQEGNISNLREVQFGYGSVAILNFIICNCPKLERLVFFESYFDQQTTQFNIDVSKVTSLEYLQLSFTKTHHHYLEGLCDLLFNSDAFSNLKYLSLSCSFNKFEIQDDLIIDCTSLVYLTMLHTDGVSVSKSLLNSNPIFTNLVLGEFNINQFYPRMKVKI